ncbi:MAG TPA: hypothetical protein VGP25_13775 [Gemmatimonadaceae bacterium]|nr:hypothetical protein [Gemmatimonadaceae bacterium]
MSVIALLVSFIFSALSVHFRTTDQRKSDEAAKVSLLRQDIISLAELSAEMTEAANRLANSPALFAQLNSNQNAKREMLIEDAERLIETLGDRVTSAQYLSFGQQVAMDSRFDEANGYFEKALKTAPTTLAKVAAYRSLAFAAMQPGVAGKAADGRRYWRAALEPLQQSDDQYSLFLSCDMLLYWASLESILGNARTADSLVVIARTKAQRVLPGPVRVQLDTRLTTPLPTAAMAKTSTALLADTMSVTGEWSLHFADGREGTLTILSTAMPNGLFPVQMTITSAGTVVETRNGSAMLAGGSVLISANYQRMGSFSAPMSYGTSNMQLRREGTRLTGTDSPLGGRPANVVTRRAETATRRVVSAALQPPPIQ